MSVDGSGSVLSVSAKTPPRFPGSYQLVYDYTSSLMVAFSMSERGYEAIVTIAIFPRWVRLYFDKSLPTHVVLTGTYPCLRKGPSVADRGGVSPIPPACSLSHGIRPTAKTVV